MRGRDGNVHRGRPREGLLAMISHLGAMISVVNGVLLARRFKGVTGTVGVAMHRRRRHFHRRFSRSPEPGRRGEAAAGAGRGQQPIRLLHAQLRGSSPAARCWTEPRATASRATRWTAPIWPPASKWSATPSRQARAGRGPQLVVAQLLRLCGHGEHDDAGYVDPKLQAVRRRAGLPEGGRGATCCSTSWADRADPGSVARRGGAEGRGSRRQGAARSRRRTRIKEDWCALASEASERRA